MTYIYVDDGHPDSRDYDNNYLFYDDSDVDDMERVLEYLDSRIAKGQPQLLPVRNALSRSIEEKRRSMQRRKCEADKGERGMRKGMEMHLQRFARTVSSWMIWGSQPSN